MIEMAKPLNNYYIEHNSGFKEYRKFETDYAAIKYYKRVGFGGLKIFKEVSPNKFELIYERKRKGDKKWPRNI